MFPTWAIHLRCAGKGAPTGVRVVVDLVGGYGLVERQEPNAVWLVNDDNAEVWALCECGAFMVPRLVVEWHNRRLRAQLGRKDS